MKHWKTTGLIAALVIILLIPIAGLRFKKQQLNTVSYAEPEFVGAIKCASCHQSEFDQWKSSHHAKAMAVANDSTVLGDFNDAVYTHDGIEHKFYKRDGKFYTYTLSVGGEMREHLISHTFGYTPLQQYLVPFEKGKYQCLPIAWDTENERWFNMAAMVYTDQDLHANDWLYWTNQAQNWNGMCAECHSTNLKKNYFHEIDSFSTSWSEINVSCEACHGPGSRHVDWADLPESYQDRFENYGLVAKSGNINNEEYINLCARCHTRRSQLGDFDHGFSDLLDIMIPTLIFDDYFPDGQILDEDYVYGSFVQSKMYHNDIKCNDCHNVHSGDRLFEGNQLCFQCHQADYYGSAQHHFHKLPDEPGKALIIDNQEIPVGEGASCVNCHMPGRYYMGIDFRNDHSLRIPRPDLSKEIGVPNACNQCHTDKSTDWAIRYYEEWYGKKHRPHYGTVLAKAREGDNSATKELIDLINEELTPLIIRATALEHLGQLLPPDTNQVIRKMLNAPESMLRLSAVRVYTSSNPDQYITDISPLLRDPAKAVRMEAGIRLSIVPGEYLSDIIKSDLDSALREYKEQNEYMADFPSGSANLGYLYANRQNYSKAIKYYEKALQTDSAFLPAAANLAQMYNRVSRNADAENLYRQMIIKHPEFNEVYYSLGLLLAEQQKYEEAAYYLKIATDKIPENSRINYNLGLIYAQLKNNADAELQFKEAIRKEPGNFDFEYALLYHYVNSMELSKADNILKQLIPKYPDNQDLKQLSIYLENLP